VAPSRDRTVAILLAEYPGGQARSKDGPISARNCAEQPDGSIPLLAVCTIVGVITAQRGLPLLVGGFMFLGIFSLSGVISAVRLYPLYRRIGGDPAG
jgi:hypothetical protein